MSDVQTGISSDGLPMHYCVGAVIVRDGRILVIDRARFPLAHACVAGHIDVGESAETALHREVREEVGLQVSASRLAFSGELKNPCRRGASVHFWYVYQCEAAGDVAINPGEVKSFSWISLTEALALQTLEPVWRDILSRVHS